METFHFSYAIYLRDQILGILISVIGGGSNQTPCTNGNRQGGITPAKGSLRNFWWWPQNFDTCFRCRVWYPTVEREGMQKHFLY